ncbi:MAG: winged helix-turn-helix domain-containing protein, partial [Myxococcaceae bacterium]
LRRANTAAPVLPTEERSVGILKLDTDAHRCFVGETEVPLTLLEFRLLHHLMNRLGRVQSREQLLEEVWELSGSLETRTVDTHVMRLREKLGDARAYVETVRGIGYRMVAPASVPAT